MPASHGVVLLSGFVAVSLWKWRRKQLGTDVLTVYCVRERRATQVCREYLVLSWMLGQL